MQNESLRQSEDWERYLLQFSWHHAKVPIGFEKGRVLVSRQELSTPPPITYEQAKGFSNGPQQAGDQVIDLA